MFYRIISFLLFSNLIVCKFNFPPQVYCCDTHILVSNSFLTKIDLNDLKVIDLQLENHVKNIFHT